MHQIAIYKNHGPKTASGLARSQEMALLGGRTAVLNQTRVMAANHLSKSVSPADLDAFLQGYFEN